MYDELKERCRACSQGCIYPSECSYFDKPPLRCMRQLLSEAADAIEELTGFVQEAERDRDEYRERLDKANEAIEELSAFRKQITDGRFYCMRDGVLYEAKVELPKGKVFQLPPIAFMEEGE